MIDIPTLAMSQAGADPEAAVTAGNPHAFDQKPLYEGWRFKPFIFSPGELTGAPSESVPYVRGVVPQPNTSLLRDIFRLLASLGITLPNFDLFGEISTE